MALKLAQQVDHTIPGTVKAILVNKIPSLQHQARAKITNSEKVQEAGRILHRIYNHE